MSNTFKKITALVLAVVLWFSASATAFGTNAGQAQQTQEQELTAQASASISGGSSPLKVEVITKKDKFFATTKPYVTVRVTNTSNQTVNNISAEAVSDTIIIGRTSEIAKQIQSLAPNQSFEFTYRIRVMPAPMVLFILIWGFFQGLLYGGPDENPIDFDDGRPSLEATKAIRFTMGLPNMATVGAKVWYEGDNIPPVELPTSYYKSDESHMIYDNSTDALGYIDNIILVWFKKEATVEDKIEVANSINGAIVGSTGGEVQIKIDPQNKNGLKKICEDISKHPKVQAANYDLVIPTKSLNFEAIPNDPWKDTFNGIWGTDWDESNPNGLNWWLEAINAPSAWDFNNRFSPINIGVVDSGFDTEHEDLDINVLNFTSNRKDNHGTHVSGIIGATANNNKGITGIAWKSKLYGVSTMNSSSNIAARDCYNAFRLLLDNGAKVINFSIANNSFKTDDEIKEWSDAATNWIASYAETFNRDDFIIVQAAGNKNRDARHSGFCASMNTQLVQSYLNRNNITSVYAKDVMSHIIIVGAVDKPQNGTYAMTNFSNYGDNVNIAAPGTDIFSTVVTGGMDGNYAHASWDGTSMAAPMVTGVTALVWSINPHFIAEEVKNIVCAYDGRTVQGYGTDSKTYNMLNALTSVTKAIQQTDGNTGRVNGEVKDRNNNPTSCTINILDSEGRVLLNGSAGNDGKFNMELPIGTYTLEFFTTTERATIRNIQIRQGQTTTLQTVALKAEDNTFAGGKGTATDPYLVSTPAQLDAVRNNLTAHYKMNNNIDLGDWGSWMPIGIESAFFSGVFDGNGFVVRNMIVNMWDLYGYSTNAFGLFGYVCDGVIKNIGIEGNDINIDTRPAYVGLIAHVIDNSIISNCYNKTNVTTITNSAIGGASGTIGGIIGRAENSTINNCYNLGNLRITSSTRPTNITAGGIVASSNSTIVANCYNTGRITASSGWTPSNGGSIAGLGSGIIINNCFFLEGSSPATKDRAFLTNVHALTDSQMKDRNSFTGFDFTNTWAIDHAINNGYPYLQGMQP